MSALDSWGDYSTPCPHCSGVVHFWFFGSDCRGNDADGGIACRGCERRFSDEAWGEIASVEMAERARDYWRSQYDAFGPYEFSPYHPDYDFAIPKSL